MSKIKKNTARKEDSKKMFRQQVEEKIGQVLSEVKSAVGEKKFKRRVRKAGKIITNGLSKKDLASSINQRSNGNDADIINANAPAINELP